MPEIEAVSAVRDFVELGGNVLFAIAALTAVMWTLIVERTVYFRAAHPADRRRVQALWDAREDHSSWDAQQIRKMLISEVDLGLNRGLGLIQTAVTLCPMFGLLGTVTGMIEVFDVMAIAGSGNARGMAAGVSKATLPTMAGMVAALPGMLFGIQLQRFARDESARVADSLEIHALAGGSRRRRSRDREESEVNLTPMLDVVFIMLIFFIVTASFVKEAGIDLSRPPAAASEKKEKGNILVSITASDQIWIDRRQVDPRSIRPNIERMHAENPTGSVVIQADAESSNGLLVQVMDAARLAGVRNVSLAAEVVE